MKIASALCLMMFTSFTAYAGPFVAGGAGLRMQCADQNLKVDVTLFGPGGGGSLLFLGSNQTVELKCQGLNQPVPAMVDTKLVAVCSSSQDKGLIQFYRSADQGQTRAVIVTQTQNGVPNPHTLSCK